MSKKKSYMNIDNILSEGIIDTLASIFLFPPNFEKYKKNKIEKLEKKLEKIDKEMADLDKQFYQNQEDMFNSYEKETGKKIKREPAKKAIRRMLDKKHKRK